MDHSAFVKAAERGQLPPIVLIHGPDPQLLDDAIATATRGLLPDASAAAFDREVFDGQSAEPEAIINAAMTMPVMGAMRLVVVRRCEALPAKAADLFTRYAAKPNPSACLLLLATESLAQRDGKAHWLLGAVPAAATIALVQRKGRAQEDWVRQRAQAEGLTVSDDAVRLLVQFVGDDSLALLGEVRKAALAGGPDNRTVGVKEVSAVVGEHRMSMVFDLPREVERRDVGAALRTLDRLLATEEPHGLLALLTREVRMAWTIKAWRERGQSVDQIARTLRRPAFAIEALATATAALSASVLARRLERCWEVERRLKSGGEARAEMGALVAELCGVEARGQASRRGA
jgi:DNA polymerase-3 subunit delta